ncbi:efflux transporter periplasmic adaptor subunit, partial [Elizabethkingia anophelis]|nr:efflux transporter periplasmic adaptor subunit [Elizabethkingia anophelis]
MKMLKKSGIIILLSGIIILLNSCSKASETVGQAPPPPQVPVYTVVSSPATTYQEF